MKVRTTLLILLLCTAYTIPGMMAFNLVCSWIYNAVTAPGITLGFLYSEDQMFVGLIIYLCAFPLALICIVQGTLAHRYMDAKPQLRKGLDRSIVVFKLLLVPYFVILTLCVLIVLLGSSLAPFLLGPWFILGLFAAPFFWLPTLAVYALNYLLIAATSVYSTSRIVNAYNDRIIARRYLIIFVILQFLPIADVISYPRIVKYIKRRTPPPPLLVVPSEPSAPNPSAPSPTGS